MVSSTPISAASAGTGFPVSGLLGVLQSEAPRLIGDGNVRLRGVRQDSRRVEPGDLFVARSGGKLSGAQFAEAAVAARRGRAARRTRRARAVDHACR